MQQTSTHGGTAYCHWSGWKTEPGDFFHIVRAYSLATVEKKELLPGSSLGHLGLRSRNNDLSYFSGAGYCGNYLNINGTPALRSFIYVDVGEPTLSPLFNDWDDAGPPPTLFETWSYLGHLFARFALPSWRSTERPEFLFLKA